MKPIDLLLQEHRRIEKVIDILQLELKHQQRTQTPNTGIILTSIDFFNMYVDFTHHSKEENILFDKLQEKELTHSHKQLLDDLNNDHEQVRLLINKLQQQTDAYRTGNENIIPNISNTLQKLTILYSKHIEKEDNDFYKPILDEYFTEKEQNTILHEFYVIDREAIHKKYEQVIEYLEEL